jgi:hypothetical protein
MWVWTSRTNSLPEACPNRQCGTREWNGKKQQGRSHISEIKFPASRGAGRPKAVALLDMDEE